MMGKSDIDELKGKRIKGLSEGGLEILRQEVKDLDLLSRFKPEVLMAVLEVEGDRGKKLCEKIIMEAQEILEAREFGQRDAEYAKKRGGGVSSASPNHGGSPGSSPGPRTKGRKSGKSRKVNMACYGCCLMYGSFTDEKGNGMIWCEKNESVKPRRTCKDFETNVETNDRDSGKEQKSRQIEAEAMAEAKQAMRPLEEGQKDQKTAPAETEHETPPPTTKKEDSGATSYINVQRTLDDWMKITRKVLSEIVFMPMEMMVENPWNPNVGIPEEDEALEQFMIEQGPEGTPPLTIRPQAQTILLGGQNLKVHQIVDGSRRFKKGRKLKWSRMLVRIRYDLDDLAAMRLTMAMNRHGHTDWYKEAKMYSSVPEKYTDKEIGGMFRVSDSHVSRRKVLLVLDEEDVRKSQEMGVQVTVLEEIAKMEDPKARSEAMKKVVSGDKKIIEETKESKTKKYHCPKCHVQSPTDKYLKCERCNLYYPMKDKKKADAKKKGK